MSTISIDMSQLNSSESITSRRAGNRIERLQMRWRRSRHKEAGLDSENGVPLVLFASLARDRD